MDWNGPHVMSWDWNGPHVISGGASVGREGGGRPGVNRRLVDNERVDRAESALDRGVHPAEVNAELARRGPGQCEGSAKLER